MAYFPVLRSKQFELVCLRENAARIALWGMSPIVEPVRDSPSSLIRALKSLDDAEVNAWVIANPVVGDLKGANLHLTAGELSGFVRESNRVNWIYQVLDDGHLDALTSFLVANPAGGVFHHGTVAVGSVAAAVEAAAAQAGLTGPHFFREYCGDRYRMKFRGYSAIAIEDGFRRQPKNSLYPEDETFSDLVLVYQARGFQGFGDYSIVGYDYLEGGGPAMAVAIHLTYKNALDEGAIHIKHFLSDSNLTVDDPAGKFREALTKLVQAASAAGSMISRTSAVKEFFELHSSGHFPGLGYVKKLCIQHHLELMGE